MRLTHLKLAGFKSFVDPTTIPLPGQLIGIVGPNGCGKSNVIDAVRWVLGESQAKHLRGESMQDVIFNGTATRKPYGRASVELIFDNSLGGATGPWAEYAEISVKRVLERDGDSSYFINNHHVRRRDITDIFLGTGLGPRAYGIIEQGMISGIVEARPEDLRLFLEEAAGVSKYRSRRREAELRLTDTRTNLSRVQDVRDELEKQVQRLEAQAEIAQQYHVLQQNLGRAHHQLWFLKKRDAEKEANRIQLQIQRLANDLEQKTAELRSTEASIEKARSEHFQASDELHRIQGLLYAANAQVASLEQKLQHQRDSHQQLLTQLNILQQNSDQIAQQLAGAEISLAESQREVSDIARLMEQTQAQLDEENTKLPLLEGVWAEMQSNLTRLQKELGELEQVRQVEETHLAHTKRSMEQLELRSRRLQEERSKFNIGDDAINTQELESSRSALESLEAELLSRTQEFSARQQLRTELQDQIQVLKQQVHKLQAEKHARERLQQHFSHGENLEAWITKYELRSSSRLWSKLKIESGWENALESVLRERLSALALADLDQARPWSFDLPPWNLTVFENVAAVSRSDSVQHLTPLLSYVSGNAPAALSEWLHQVYAVESEEDGWRRRSELPPGGALVSRNGHIFTRHSVSFYSPEAEAHGVLTRQREIEQLASELGPKVQILAEKEAALAEAEASSAPLQEAIEELRRNIGHKQHAHHQLEMDLQQRRQQEAHRRERFQQIEAELAEIASALATEQDAAHACQVSIAQNREQLNANLALLTDAQAAYATALDELNTHKQILQNLLHAKQDTHYKRKHAEQRIADLDAMISAAREQHKVIGDQLSASLALRDTYSEQSLQNELQEAIAQQSLRERELASAREILEAAANNLHQLEYKRLSCDQALEPLREQINAARLKEQEAVIVAKQFLDQLQNAGVDEIALAETTPAHLKPHTVQTEIERLVGEIAQLGAVNLAALEELTAERERKVYLENQSRDLEEAMATLEQAIAKIDRETRDRLEVTFKDVNRYLDELFPAVFGGGQAQLVLTGEHILDAGLQLIAQPPGKKTSSIHLLSGGEKALTALALVFSLFRLNPSPFCMLDEVDAPLDDANTERFCELVKRMSQYTQFIFISHNKITMEMAQQLIGVTMRESGVSHIVAVDMEEAVKFAEATPV